MRRAARTDNTAANLVKATKQLGAKYLPLNSVVDGVIQWKDRTILVDWKSKGGTLTPAQAKLVAEGWRIEFVSTPEQLEDLLR